MKRRPFLTVYFIVEVSYRVASLYRQSFHLLQVQKVRTGYGTEIVGIVVRLRNFVVNVVSL